MSEIIKKLNNVISICEDLIVLRTWKVVTQISIVSTGALESDFDENQVVQNIISAFKISSEDAINFLQKDVVIRNNISQEFADKLADRFSQQGLKVVVRQANVVQDCNDKETLQATLNNSPESKADFEKLLKGEFTQNKVSFSYRWSLLLALMMSFITPIIYVGILLSLLYSFILYGGFLSNHLGDISGTFLKILAVIIPYFIMTILIVFLITPLFSSYARPKYFEMRRADGPALYNLIAVMCEKIGVPFPDQICLDTEVNASAGPVYGYSSLSQKKLRLTIGLPFLLGLNVRQFSGILAHEFGHFAQSFAMKTYYIIYAISLWFQQRAYQPDTLDEQLEEWSDKADWHFSVTLAISGAQFAIKVTRLIFKLLYKLNFRLIQNVSRAMEYDADSYESRFVGSNQFEKTSVTMRKLFYAAGQAHQVNKASWNDDRLLANLPQAIIDFADKTDQEIIKTIHEDMQIETTSAMDSHPADNDRISHVECRNDLGIFHCEFPAKQLVKSIDKLCELVTIDAYKLMGINNPSQYVVANHKLIDRDQRKQSLQQSYKTFFNESSHGRLLNLTPLLQELPKTHIECMNSIRKLKPEFSLSIDKFYTLLEQVNVASLAKAYWQSGVKIDPVDFNIKASNMREVESEIGNIKHEMKQLQNSMYFIDQLFYQRILFNKEQLTQEQNREVDELLNNLQAMYPLESILIDLQRHTYLFHNLLKSADEIHEKIMPTIDKLADSVLLLSDRVIGEAKNIKISDEKFNTLGQFIESWTGTLPTRKNSFQLDDHFTTADQICKAIHYQYYWQFAEITLLCCNAERSNKITSLCFPEQDLAS